MGLRKLFSRILPQKQYRIQTFTYYIPAPPPRNTGYREKEFDKAFYHFINKGYEIVSLQTQSNNGTNSSGMWVVCAVRALTKEADQLDLETEFEEILAETTDQPIEGLYYMDS